jgi:endonuclease-3
MVSNKVKRIFQLLEKRYKFDDWTTNLKPVDILVATILSQNTTDKNSSRAYAALRHRYRTWNKVMNAPLAEVAETIKHGGLPHIKAKRIQEALAGIKSRSGKLDLDFLNSMDKSEAMEFLTSLHGVGPKTAAVVLGFAFGKATIPVDTHIHRVANRLGIASAKTPAKTQ